MCYQPLVILNTRYQIFVTRVTSIRLKCSFYSKERDKFLILTLNVSINAKFNDLFPVINNLTSRGLYFGAICLQETWTSSDSDLSLLQLPGYQLIHQGSKCDKHGGLIIYLNENYNSTIRNLYNSSNIWEGLFININGIYLCRTLTIGNIYRPPPYNKNNNVYYTTIDRGELSPIMEIFQSENTYTACIMRTRNLLSKSWICYR